MHRSFLQMMLPESLTKKMVSGWHLQKTMLHGTVRRTRRQLLTVTR